MEITLDTNVGPQAGPEDVVGSTRRSGDALIIWRLSQVEASVKGFIESFDDKLERVIKNVTEQYHTKDVVHLEFKRRDDEIVALKQAMLAQQQRTDRLRNTVLATFVFPLVTGVLLLLAAIALGGLK